MTSPLGYISKIHLEYPLKLQYSTLPLNRKAILLTTLSYTIGEKRDNIYNFIKAIHLYVIGSFQYSSVARTTTL